MARIGAFVFSLLLAGVTLPAQSVTPGTIQANGTATVTVNPPETAQLTVGVVTDGTTADEAAQKNAAIATAIIAAVQAALGPNGGTVQTAGYYISARYDKTPLLVGYTVSNTLYVVSYSPSTVGKLIDAATAAGANSTGGISFGLRNPEPYIQQALTQASKIALARASAIAAGFNMKAGPVISAQESSSYVPVMTGGVSGTAASTPIQTGGVTVTANVTVNVQLVQ